MWEEVYFGGGLAIPYLGGKHRIRYQVSEYINSLSPRVYLEPFCGYCYVGERVRCTQRYFSDLNEDIILMWQALQDGWKPPTIVTEEQYKQLRDAHSSALRGFVRSACGFCGDMAGGFKRDVLSAERGFVASACTFGSKGFSGFARNAANKNYAAVGARSLLRRIHSLKTGHFGYTDYRQAMDEVDADVIYCDPPYENTTTYGMVDPFDSKMFWEEIRKRSDGKRRILVSEYVAPDDFTVVLTAYSRMGLNTKTEEAGLHKALREEKVFEYQPPKGRGMVSFGSLLD